MSLLERLNRDGFVLVPGAFTGEALETLRRATQDATANARRGNWPDVRTLPKQFPPWKVDGPNPAAEGIWGVQGVMHPDMPHQPDFVRVYFSDAIVAPTLEMEPGDIVFYNNNILHRGMYDSKVERMTLHGSAGHVDGAKLRARNVLQHGLRNWIDRLNFDALEGHEKELAEHMRANLVKMGQDAGDVGFSLQG